MQEYESEFMEHPDLAVTWAVGPAFLQHFGEGFAAYQSGKWDVACRILRETRRSRSTDGGKTIIDGPSNTLLDFMAVHGNEAPADWKGFRELTEK